MNILVATGNLKYNDRINKVLKKRKRNHITEITMEEELIKFLETENPEVLITAFPFYQETEMRMLIKQIRMKHPNTRIVFLLNEEEEKEMDFLHEWMIYDVAVGKIKSKQLIELVK